MSDGGATPSQTVGPYFAIGLTWQDGPVVAEEGVTIWGHVLDGAGDPLPDAVIETWQSDPPAHADFRGFARAATDDDGRWEIRTLRPGGDTPFLDVSVLGRGLLHRLVTRIYFDAANAPDFVPEDRRETLVAQPDGEDRWRFDIRLQGKNETVFFAL
jgi:protocatechuate 3,4-dioxygenase, alpha subunit